MKDIHPDLSRTLLCSLLTRAPPAAANTQHPPTLAVQIPSVTGAQQCEVLFAVRRAHIMLQIRGTKSCRPCAAHSSVTRNNTRGYPKQATSSRSTVKLLTPRLQVGAPLLKGLNQGKEHKLPAHAGTCWHRCTNSTHYSHQGPRPKRATAPSMATMSTSAHSQQLLFLRKHPVHAHTAPSLPP